MTKNNIQEIESEDFPELHNDIMQLPKDSKLYTQHVLNIPRYVKFTLSTLGLNQNYLAENLSKTDAEISKWLSGKQNITLRTISRLEAALSIDLINPEIKKLIDSLKGAEIAKSPIYTYPTGSSSVNYNVFIIPSVSHINKNIFTEGAVPTEQTTSINIKELLPY